MLAIAAAAVALIASGHSYTTPPSACHGRGWYTNIAVRDVPSGKYLRRHWNRDHDRLLFAGEHGWVHFDGVRVVNRSHHRVSVRGWC